MSRAAVGREQGGEGILGEGTEGKGGGRTHQEFAKTCLRAGEPEWEGMGGQIRGKVPSPSTLGEQAPHLSLQGPAAPFSPC